MISIIVPVYNVAPFLNQCIQSIVSQSYSDFECILVDDGSTDGSGNICDQWKIKDRRIKVIHQTNQGVSSARNKGLSVARGEYIAFIDSDDWVEHDYLEILMLKMNHRDCDLSVGGMTANYKDGSIKISSYKDCRIEISPIGSADFIEIESLYLLFGPVIKIYKKKIIDQFDIHFDSNLSYGEDLLFNYEYLQHIKTIYTTRMDHYHYRILWSDNLSCKPRKDFFEINYQQWIILMNFHIKKNIYTEKARLLLYNRLWGIIYDALFLLPKFETEKSIKFYWTYIRKIIKCPEIDDVYFQQINFNCPTLLKALILQRNVFLLTIILYIKL